MSVSIREIAQQAQVSTTTVTRFLKGNYGSMSEATRQRIEAIVEESGYEYHRKKKNTDRIGLILPDITNPFFAQMVSSLEYAASAHGLELVLGITNDNFEKETELVHRYSSGSIDGIIYMSTVSAPDNCYAYLKEMNIPFVAMDSYLQNEDSVPASVCVDGYRAMYELTMHLIDYGHRDIAYISELKYSSFKHNRYTGHTNALLESGITVNPELVKFCGFGPDNGAESFLSLRDAGVQFTAVICENDMIAFGVADECRKLGLRIPDDLSLTGFDNTVMAQYYNPPLTSVNQHLGQQADNAIDMLLRMLRGETFEGKHVNVQPTLVLRESVKKI